MSDLATAAKRVDAPDPAETELTGRGERRRSPRAWGMTTLLAVVSIIAVSPFFFMLILALTPSGGVTIPNEWPDELTLENITRMFKVSSFARWALNTAIYSIVSVVIVLFTAAMAGYALARKKFRGRHAILWAFVATLMVPFQTLLIPYFVLVSNLGGVDTYWGLIVPTLANAQAVFLMHQFIRDLPMELFDAAKVDGAPDRRIFLQIVLPLTKPIMATLGIFVFLWHWNDFLWPLVIAQRDEMRTLTVGLSTLRTADVSTPELMAAAMISVVPCLVVFMVLQRYLVNSITITGLK